jgi:hypothetical protein
MWLKKNASRLFQEFFWHTQFIEGFSEGYDGEAAIQYADEVCYRALYSSEAGNGGPMYRGTVAAAVTQFSAEPVNFLGYVLEKAKQKKLWNKAGAIGSILLYGVLVSALEWLVSPTWGLNPVALYATR